jgi:hypothetical protein
VSLQKVFIIFSSTEQGTPIIYVSMNYRLGPLGFPQGREAQDRNALNLGLKDQLAGLEWIKANIGAFGGDETKVLATHYVSSLRSHFYTPRTFGVRRRSLCLEKVQEPYPSEFCS